MDRTEAVEVLTKMLDCEDIDFCDSDCFKCRLFTKAVDRSNALIMAIKALGKDIDVPSKWIPVSEKLPEEDGIYLVSGGGKVWSAQCLTFGCFRGWSNDARNPAVIAWMPLPEPYKEGEENENVN